MRVRCMTQTVLNTVTSITSVSSQSHLPTQISVLMTIKNAPGAAKVNCWK